MPRSDNLPSLATEIVEVLSPTNPSGIKAGGEGGCAPALAVVVSAILDALAPLGDATSRCLPHHSRCGRRPGYQGGIGGGLAAEQLRFYRATQTCLFRTPADTRVI
jgi:hypothetical protein